MRRQIENMAQPAKSRRHWPTIAALVSLLYNAAAASDTESCSVLEPALAYTQHGTPADIGSDLARLLQEVTGVEAVSDLRIQWRGAPIQALVGSYELEVQASVAGNLKCYYIKVNVNDTNECHQNTPADWRHRCDASTQCVNTIGSYYCTPSPNENIVACKVLPMQTYVQHQAPTDVTGDVTEVINEISDEPIEDVRLTWLGAAVHASVGVFDIVANVTLEGGRGTRCYTRRIKVTDTNECDDRTPLNWRHRCDTSSRCVNTDGSYICACDEDYFAPRNAPFGCGGYSNTSDCCDSAARRGPRKKAMGEFESCVASFKCEPNFCDSICVPEATCARTVLPYGSNRRVAQYECACKEGWIGTGRTCPDSGSPPLVFIDDATGKIRHDGEIPCSCQVGLKDPCSGVRCGDNAFCVPRADGTADCHCAAGFTLRNETSSTWMTKEKDSVAAVVCVDETLPVLKIRGKVSLEISQCGEPYEELGVQIMDDVADAYEQTLRIAYSNARDFPSRGAGYRLSKPPFFKRGDYHVSYRIDTPWRVPNYVEATRLVSVVDEDECSLPPNHPCAPRCSPYAACINEVGGYRCVCPTGAVGDGFLGLNSTNPPPEYWQRGHGADNPDAWRVPKTFSGGTGCADIVKPNLMLLGPNPIILRVERCLGLSLTARYASLRTAPHHVRRSNVSSFVTGRNTDAEVVELVERAPEVLCEHADPKQCAVAYDTNPVTGEQVDLSSRVAIGRPFQVDHKADHPPNSVVYSIPYYVADDSGNVETVYRELILKVMTLDEVETEVRQEVQASSVGTAPCEKQPEETSPQCDRLPQPPAGAAKAFCNCDSVEDADRRRAHLEAEAASLRHDVARLEAELSEVERRKLLLCCALILAFVVALISLYSASESIVNKPKLRKDLSSEFHKQAVNALQPPQPMLGRPNVLAGNGTTSPQYSSGYQTPSVVRGTPRQSPFSS